MLGELGLLLAVLGTLRSTLVISTTLPSPVRSCIGASSLEQAQAGFVAAETYCNDLMFSGHTACHMVLGHVWASSPVHTVLKVAVFLYVAGCLFMSVAVRDHYTMDVLVATYVAVPVCLLRRPKMVRLLGSDHESANDGTVFSKVV